MIAAEQCGVWSELEARLRPYVARRVASPLDVDDVVQDVFERIYRGHGQLRDPESFGGWVYGIARRTIADHGRARARHPLPIREPSPGDGSGLEPGAPQEDENRLLEAALTECVALFAARLKTPQREAITLTELEGLTQREAAEVMGVSLSGMKSRVQRGRQRLRRMFDSCCDVTLDARGRVLECTPRPLHQVPPDCRDAARDWYARARRHSDECAENPQRAG